MMCNKQTMIRTGVGLGASLVTAYAPLPQFRAFIVGLSPILLSLLRPLSMIFTMKGMASAHKQANQGAEAAMPGKRGAAMPSDRSVQAEFEAGEPGWFVHTAAVQCRYRIPSPRR